ncbi:MAG: SOS response-associated peptidase family protein [Methanobacteriota archaeon]
MAGLEGIDASKMEIVDALGVAKWNYDPVDRVVRPLVRHMDFLPVAVNVEGERVVEKVRFGMPAGPGGRIITNARDDSIAEATSWKRLFGKAEHHSLTAVSYVVERDQKTKEAYRIQRTDGTVMVVPGLVARRHITFASTGNEYDDLCHVQITADANPEVATVHDRFVCDLATREARDLFMAPEGRQQEELLSLLRPAPKGTYELVKTAPDVWKRRDDPEAAKPLADDARSKEQEARGTQRRLF